MSLRFAERHASIISRHLALLTSIGFSHSTCRPIFAARMVYSACIALGSTT